MEYQIIKPNKIEKLMFNEGEYIIEFCEAGLTSYREFIENYEKHMRSRNIEGLQKAGHKIKPGLQMMGADIVLEEYEHAKGLLQSEATDKEINRSIEKMSDFCNIITRELENLAGQY